MSILPLDSRDATLATAGGKGANLAELVRAGFRVPPGFIITTDAYRQFVWLNHLQDSILQLLASTASFVEASRAIAQRFAGAVYPAELADTIRSAYRQLGAEGGSTAPAVAVRSSATVEDLPGLAFAGQQDTFLNVIGEEKVLDAVTSCWASLWTARALAYRAHNAVPSEDIALAVVVQLLVPAVAAGVLFTANPVTGARGEMVIDASLGLGEAVVSGITEPDHYRVTTSDWRISEHMLGAKETLIVPAVGGGTEKKYNPAPGAPALDDERILELARLGARVADHFGAPQDIEWGWAEDGLYLLQTRPITSLYPLPANPNPERGLRYYINLNATQGVTEPLTPLGIDALRLIFSGFPRLLHLARPISDYLPAAGGRLFIDVTDLVRDARVRPRFIAALASAEPEASQILGQLASSRKIEPTHALTPLRVVRLFGRAGGVLARIASSIIAPSRVYPRALEVSDRMLHHLDERLQASQTLGDVLGVMESELPKTDKLAFRFMPTALPVFSLMTRVDRWLVEWLSEPPGSAQKLLGGLMRNVTIEMNLALWQAVQAIRGDSGAKTWFTSRPAETLAEAYLAGKLPPTAQRAVARFMATFGLRGTAEIDLGRTRWRDNPTPVMQMLLGLLEVTDPSLAPDLVYRKRSEQAEALVQKTLARLGQSSRRRLAGAIHRIRSLSGLREVPLFYLARALGMLRSRLLASGQELVGAGALARADDIFFVPLATLNAFTLDQSLNLRAVAAANRADYEREMRRRQMPRVLLSSGEAFYHAETTVSAAANELVGQAVSPGIAEGRVHVILDPGSERLAPGEILVCRGTDPGWTPLFLTAGGLVMEIGGLVTHGAIVAREYGLPAVVGIHEATTRLRTGQWVRVDGNQGRVVVLEESGDTHG